MQHCIIIIIVHHDNKEKSNEKSYFQAKDSHASIQAYEFEFTLDLM